MMGSLSSCVGGDTEFWLSGLLRCVQCTRRGLRRKGQRHHPPRWPEGTTFSTRFSSSVVLLWKTFCYFFFCSWDKKKKLGSKGSLFFTMLNQRIFFPMNECVVRTTSTVISVFYAILAGLCAFQQFYVETGVSSISALVSAVPACVPRTRVQVSCYWLFLTSCQFCYATVHAVEGNIHITPTSVLFFFVFWVQFFFSRHVLIRHNSRRTPFRFRNSVVLPDAPPLEVTVVEDVQITV